MNIENIECCLSLCKAKRTNNNKWIEGFHFKWSCGSHYILNSSGCYEVYGESVCNCTGKSDINGRLVYLGDIVKSYNDDLFPDDETIETVVMGRYGLAFQQGDYFTEPINDGDLEKCEVVGNICDNTVPEFVLEDIENNELDRKVAQKLEFFVEECKKMAEENWCPAQVDMLKRLFGAVIEGVAYDEWRPEE